MANFTGDINNLVFCYLHISFSIIFIDIPFIYNISNCCFLLFNRFRYFSIIFMVEKNPSLH